MKKLIIILAIAILPGCSAQKDNCVSMKKETEEYRVLKYRTMEDQAMQTAYLKYRYEVYIEKCL